MPEHSDAYWGILHPHLHGWQMTWTHAVQSRSFEIQINDDSGDDTRARAARLENAQGCYERFVANQPVIRQEIIDYFLPLYNGEWRDDEHPELTSEQFLEHIYIETLIIRTNNEIEVFYYYDDNKLDLFVGHHLLLVIDKHGNVRDRSL